MYTLRRVDHNYLENFEKWCWRRIRKIIWTDHMRNRKVLHGEEGKEYPTYNKKKKG